MYNVFINLDLCPPNTYSSNGVFPCASCEDRAYQLEYGASKCLICDFNPLNIEACGLSGQSMLHDVSWMQPYYNLI